MCLHPGTKSARRASWLAVVLVLGLGSVLAALTGCAGDPSKPNDTSRTQPPSQLPDDFPVYGSGSDSSLVPPGGEPGNPGQPPLPPSQRGMWVRYRAFNDPARPDVGLWILHGGLAAAMSLDEGPPAHHAWIPPDTMAIVAGWFDAAGFRGLTQDSYFSGSAPGRICEIFLGDSTGAMHRVIGEEGALPEAVVQLARDLEGLAVHILVSTPGGTVPPPGDSTGVPPPPPPPPPMMALRCDLSVSPVSAPEGTPRAIRLALQNTTRDTVIVHFRTTQIYDLVLVDAWMEPPPPPGGDSTWVPPNPPPGGDSTWVPPPPGGDSTWVPPPPGGDSTGVPPHPPGDPSDPPPDGGPGTPGGCPGGTPGGAGGHGRGWMATRIALGAGWTPPDSGGCGSDTVWMPPPDSTMTPPDRLIWNWAHGREFLPVTTSLAIAPGGSVFYDETWDGKSNEAEIVGPGVYMFSAPVLADLPVMSGITRIEVTQR